MVMRQLILCLAVFAGSAFAADKVSITSLGELDCYLQSSDPANPLVKASPMARHLLARDTKEFSHQGRTYLHPRVDGVFRDLAGEDAQAVMALLGFADPNSRAAAAPPYRLESCTGATQSANGPVATARAAVRGDSALPPNCAYPMLLDSNVAPALHRACWAQLTASGDIRQLRVDTLMDASLLLQERAGERGDGADVDSFSIVQGELDRRPHADDADTTERLYGLLLETGRADEADAMVRAGKVPEVGPVLKRVPMVPPPAAHLARYWRSQPGQAKLLEQAVDLTHGRHVLAYMAPSCGYCARAANAIDADPQLAALFAAHGHWVHKPDSNYSLAYFDYWNTQHAGMPVDVIFDRRNWPGPNDHLLVPTFVFVKDGAVVAQQRGWPEDGMTQLRGHLQALGLLP